MVISQTKIFGKQKKKLFSNQIRELDKIVREIIVNPLIGEMKKGDLQKIRIYKFRMFNQEYLLSYIISEASIILLSMGTHENFYRDLKKML